MKQLNANDYLSNIWFADMLLGYRQKKTCHKVARSTEAGTVEMKQVEKRTLPFGGYPTITGLGHIKMSSINIM